MWKSLLVNSDLGLTSDRDSTNPLNMSCLPFYLVINAMDLQGFKQSFIKHRDILTVVFQYTIRDMF